ncbi:MAG: polyphosphate kinase 1 [Sedimentisphaerales bacterium]|jgi:polyphosphate kinase
MRNKNLDSQELYINRELSWLKFNERVLKQGTRKDVPLAERLKFLAIVSSNLDEFFMIRVAGLMQQKSAGLRRRDISGLTPNQQLKNISLAVHEMVARQGEAIREALAEVSERGVFLLRQGQWSQQQRVFLREYFQNEIMPVLTPLAMSKLDPPPILPGRQLNVVITVVAKGSDNQPEKRIIAVPVPHLLQRFVRMPSEKDFCLVPLEDVIADNVELLCPASHITGVSYFRITRDADVSIQEDEAADLLETIERAMIERRRGAAIRLEISDTIDASTKTWLIDWLELNFDDVYEIALLLDATCLHQLTTVGPIANLKYPEWPPQRPIDLWNSENVWQTIREKDVLLFHPYESFEPVVDLVESAAEDPDVIAIKQTLYRTSSDSAIIKALAKAARNGKEVIVLVELKARFDETQNVNWAKQLEDAGCHVIHGIANLKTHAKALLIVRRERVRIRRYVHLATGNYNDKTAKLYSDIGLFTCDKSIVLDVTAFFNLLTGMSETVGWRELTIAPTDMRQRFLDLIEREVQASSADQPGLIMAKVNSLQDKGICQALYRAGQAGVKVLLNVRGICCLRPGVTGVSDNIEVCSIVDRYLEHARIFYFRNGGHEEVYLSSADWMRRNLDRRLELLCPIKDNRLKRRLIDILNIYFMDNTQSETLQSDGTYTLKVSKGAKMRAQEDLYRVVCEGVRNNQRSPLRYKPLKSRSRRGG